MKNEKTFEVCDSNAPYATHLLDPNFLCRHLDANKTAEACNHLLASVSSEKESEFIANYRTKTGNFKYSCMWICVETAEEFAQTVLEHRRKLPPFRWWQAFHPNAAMFDVAIYSSFRSHPYLHPFNGHPVCKDFFTRRNETG